MTGLDWTALVVAFLLAAFRIRILSARVERLETHTGLWVVAAPSTKHTPWSDDQLLDDIAELRRLPEGELERLLAQWVAESRETKDDTP